MSRSATCSGFTDYFAGGNTAVALRLNGVFFTFRADFALSEGPAYLADDEDSEIGVGPRRNRGERSDPWRALGRSGRGQRETFLPGLRRNVQFAA
jgi:hypothetical protein